MSQESGLSILRRSEAIDLARKGKLIGFGAGEFGLKTQQFLGGMLAYFVDSAEDKWGTRLEGQWDILPPSVLKDELSSDTAVIICTEQYEGITERLRDEYPEMTVYHSPLLADYEVFHCLLNCSRTILVSAYGASGGLYLVNGRDESHTLLEPGGFRGLLQMGDRLLVAMEIGEIREVLSIDPFESRALYTSEVVSQMHGLAYWESGGGIVVVEADFDRLLIMDANTFCVRDCIDLIPRSGSLEKDLCHANDLAIVGNSAYTSMISRTGQWKKGVYDGCILEIDLTGKKPPQIVADGLLFPHSVTRVGNAFWLLDSLTGRVVSSDGETIAQLGGFVRGLAVDGDRLYVGQSRNRRLDAATRFMDTVSMDSGVYVVSPSSKVQRFIKLPEMCDVYDIVSLEQGEGKLNE